MSFTELNRSIWSIVRGKLIKSSRLDFIVRSNKELVLKNCYTIVHINGYNYEEFTLRHQFIRPNDIRDKYLMDHCAKSLIEQFKPHIILSYGFSDQFCFVIDRCTNFCGRNLFDTLSMIVSSFTSNYVFNWNRYFGDNRLHYAPTFTGSTLMIPDEDNLINYLVTKQHECYITNLNRTLYSALVGKYRRYLLNDDQISNDRLCAADRPLGSGYRTEMLKLCTDKAVSNAEAIKLIRMEINTISKINEYLFKEFGINYNNELELFRKGTFICRNQTNSIEFFSQKLKFDFLSSVIAAGRVETQVISHDTDSTGKQIAQNRSGIDLSDCEDKQTVKKLKTSEPVDNESKITN